MHAAVLLPVNQPRLLHHPEVLRHRHEGDVEGLGEIRDRGASVPGEPSQDRATNRVRERTEGSVEVVVGEGDHVPLQ